MRKVVLSKSASTKLSKLIDYIAMEWSDKAKNDFLQKFDKSINQIKHFPESCPESNSIKGLRKLVITKQTSLYYQFDEDNINIVSIIDNRMNPLNIKKEIE